MTTNTASVRTRYPDDSNHKNEDYLREKYWVDGWSLRDIANACDVSVGSVQYQFDKYEIPTRTANKDKPCSFYTDKRGYERATSCGLDVGIHRLCVVAWFGWSEMVDKGHVHHHSEVPWDNRESNLEPVTNSQHASYHNTGGTYE